jgi:predicted Zn-dependent protease with MMP-like domain
VTSELKLEDWSGLFAPSLAEFEALADRAWKRLPARFRDMCGNVVVRVDDFASEEALDSLGIEDPFELMGLYHGVSLDKKSSDQLPSAPDMVFLYRRPILDYWAEGEEKLGALVTHVLIHEIGHHFGLSDDDMEAVEAEAAG